MTIAHFSDTHLGYRAFSRATDSGINQREYDVMRTFRECLNAIAERDPDIVVHSGDFFHLVRPSNHTIVGAFRALCDFQARRNGKPLIVIGGNHDTPRVSESGNILNLFTDIPGLIVRTGHADHVDVPGADLELFCIPSTSVKSGERPEYAPTLKRKHSILTIHGMALQAISEAAEFSVTDTKAEERWTYVALGDYHIHQPYGDNICYAGSTDYTSTNIWDEKPPKGWVWFDTEKGKLEFVTVETRPVIDLPRIDAEDLTPEELEERIYANARWSEAEQPIVRQRVTNVHPDVRARLGIGVIRDLNARCMNYLLRLLPPELTASDNDYPRTEAITLEKSWEQHVAALQIPPGIEREPLKDLGLSLLKEVDELAADPA